MATTTVPRFLPYPFARLRQIARGDAAFESACARWLGARTVAGGSLGRLLGGPVALAFDGVMRGGRAIEPEPVLLGPDAPTQPAAVASPIGASTLVASPGARRASSPPVDGHAQTLRQSRNPVASDPSAAIDRDAAYAELRIAGARVSLVGSGLAVRGIAQRLLGGPAELAASRPLVPAEHAIFALLVATACEDLGVVADVVPCGGPPAVRVGRELGVRLAYGGLELAIAIGVPDELELRVAPARPPATWTERVMFALPIVAGRCALTGDAIAALAPRDIVTLEGHRDRLELAFGQGVIGLHASANAVEARVTTDYHVRDMALPDDAHAELTVIVGTTQLSLRQLVELTIGQVVPLGRPLAGPFELRVAGKAIGTGELVDIDGELGVRVLSVGD